LTSYNFGVPTYFRIGSYPGKSGCFAEFARFGFLDVVDSQVYLSAFRAGNVYGFPEHAFHYPVNGHVADIAAPGIHSLGSNIRPVVLFIIHHFRVQPRQ
jgi:hypothetical protein